MRVEQVVNPVLFALVLRVFNDKNEMVAEYSLESHENTRLTLMWYGKKYLSSLELVDIYYEHAEGEELLAAQAIKDYFYVDYQVEEFELVRRREYV